jgi:hypothetical protein
LRKKKCDEGRPGCSRCASVDIQCHYGHRPEWIADSALSKSELARIKIKVSTSAKRKRAAFRARIQSSSGQPSDFHNDHLAPEVSSPSNQNTSLDTIGERNVSQQDVGLENPTSNLVLSEDNETRLMMHYLDYVFFIQFRFYTPSVSAGGRGWLLSLLRSTKPLYHAALSLSAFHQQSLLSIDQDGCQIQKDHLQELERHHNLTLEELQLFILAHGEVDATQEHLGGNVQILACMVELISFEVWINFVLGNL